MLPLTFALGRRRSLEILCLGAHSDDLEIGCAGTLLELLRRYSASSVNWVVASAAGERAGEAKSSARALLRKAKTTRIFLGDHLDGHFPTQLQGIKSRFEQLKRSIEPDLIFTHSLEDRHQDHCVIAELTWQTWRDHLIVEYEIPKYEGDLGRPNLYVPLPAAVARRKTEHLLRHFGSQRSKAWFTRETFLGLMRLRGIECRARDGLAEAFVARKTVL